MGYKSASGSSKNPLLLKQHFKIIKSFSV